MPFPRLVSFTSLLKINAAKVYFTIEAAVKDREIIIQSNYKIDVADLPRGVYFLQVESNDKRRE